MSVDDLVDAMLDLGWQTSSKDPAGILRNTLGREEKKKKVQRNDDGTYSLPNED